MITKEKHKQHYWKQKGCTLTKYTLLETYKCERCGLEKRISLDRLTKHFLSCCYVRNETNCIGMPACFTFEQTLF